MEDNWKKKYEDLMRDIDIAIEGQGEGETKIVLQNLKQRSMEREDERIRKTLIQIVNITPSAIAMNNRIELIAWLEKQGEQKGKNGKDGENFPITEWSEEDEKILNTTISFLSEYVTKGYENAVMCTDWLKSLRPQNWTKEDKERYISCLQRLSTGNPEQPETINSKWFKEHVYSQNTWKPSEQDILFLEGIANGKYNPQDFQASLGGLIGQLKKLKES